MITFHVLGALDLQAPDGRHLGSPLSGAKRLALLAYLAVASRGGIHRRDTLLGMFWPELDQKRARNSLSNMLHHIRGSLGPDALVAHGHESIGLRAGLVWCDAIAFQDAVEEGRLIDALELYRGDLLDGLFVPGASPEFEYWLDAERARLRRSATGAARVLVKEAEGAEDIETAIRLARKAFAMDPYDEVGARRLVGLLDRAGDRAGALRTYDELATRLRREFDAEPSAETQALIDGIRQNGEPLQTPSPPGAGRAMAGGSTVGRATAGSSARSGRPEIASARSIAVLPFENLTGGTDAEPFATGLHDDLLTELSRISALTVIARTSVLRYRGTGKSAPEIARELGVGAIVEGGVQTSGGRLRLNVQLIDAQVGAHQWAERYDRELSTDNIFELQGELASQIARALRARLTPAERQRSGQERTGSLEAYRLHAHGRRFLDQRTEIGMRRSLEYFERAIELDPGYALAWVGLSDAQMLLYTYEHETGDDAFSRADEATGRALSLDPLLAEARAALGLLHSARREGPAAIRELQRAIQLRPSYAEAHNWLSWNFQLLGHRKDALESAKRAVELDPMSPEAVSNLSLSLLTNRDFEAALREARRVRDLQPDWTTGPLLEGLALYHLEQHGDAIGVLHDLSVEWAGSGAEVTLALACIACGDTARAAELRIQFEKAGDAFATGLVRLALGDTDRAFETLAESDWWEYWPTLSVHHFYPEVLAPLRAAPLHAVLQQAMLRRWGLED